MFRFIDPIFAVGVGLSAAYVRIQREEREKHPGQDASAAALWEKGARMMKSYFGREEEK